MKPINILIAGIGGQGLVMTTDLICQAAFLEGYEMKSNDVIGLAQRGGRIWGSVRIGTKVLSPDIPVGTGDILIGVEPMEALRWRNNMKADAKIVLNHHQVYPTNVQQEKENYPDEAIHKMLSDFDSLEVDAGLEARKCGNEKAANTLMLGCVSEFLPISEEKWMEAIRRTFPEKVHAVNEKAWKKGKQMAGEAEFR